MFEKFTDRARRVLVLGQEEARLLNHNFIGTEHLLLGLTREGESVGARVLETLGADPPRIRQQVLGVLSGQSSAEVLGVTRPGFEERRDGPRCPTCTSLLEGHVAYRVLPVSPVEQPEASTTIDVVIVYCLRCGVMLAHTSAGDRADGADRDEGDEGDEGDDETRVGGYAVR